MLLQYYPVMITHICDALKNRLAQPACSSTPYEVVKCLTVNARIISTNAYVSAHILSEPESELHPSLVERSLPAFWTAGCSIAFPAMLNMFLHGQLYFSLRDLRHQLVQSGGSRQLSRSTRGEECFSPKLTPRCL